MANELAQQCANCKWSAIFKDDLKKRFCHGAPPQLVALPVNGGIQLTPFWPIVDAAGPICSLFAPKIIKLDIKEISV